MRNHLIRYGCLSILSAVFSGGLYAQDIQTESFTIRGNTAHSYIDIQIDLPLPGQGLAIANIRKQIIELVDIQLATRNQDNGRERVFPAFTGNSDNSMAWADYYRNKTVEAIGKESQEQAEAFEDEDWSMNYDWSFEKSFENDRFVVFNAEGFYQGSDMMRAVDIGQGPFTFDKQSGRLVRHFFKTEIDLYDIQPLIRRGLAQYFSEGEEVDYGYDIDGELLASDELIPLPKQTPRPVEYGLVFTYQEGEITIYSAGKPEFLVDYSDILPYMAPEAIQVLLGYKDVSDNLSDKALELCHYIPDHGIILDSERYMTPDFYRAVSEAFSAPDGAYGEIGDSEWLLYFVTGQEGEPYYTVKHVYQVDQMHAIADISVQTIIHEISDKPGDEIHDHQIEMTLVNGKWLLSDFDKVKQKCIDYIQDMRRKYRSGEILDYLQSNEYTREYIPEFKKALEDFYRAFGDGEPKMATRTTEYAVTVTSNPDVDTLPAKNVDPIPFGDADNAPMFNGGSPNEFVQWANSQIEYPQDAKDNGVQGRVIVQFTITSDGSVTDVSVIRGVSPSLDKEVVRVVSNSPKWIPATKDGYRIPVFVQFQHIFQLR